MMRPNLAALDGLTFRHLWGPDDLVHKVAEEPHANETEGNDKNKQRSQSRNSEKDLKLVAGRDDKKCEIDDNEK